MSSWDHGEALKLKVHGNDYARKVWLATAPPPGVGGRPSEGDDIGVFKRFVVDAYEQRRYYRDPSGSDSKDQVKDVTGIADSATDVPSTNISSSMSSTTLVHTPSSSVGPVVVDLLDFAVFDTPTPPSTSIADSAPPVCTSSDAFFDPFNNDSASLVADVSSQSASTATINKLTSSHNNSNNCNNNTSQINNIMSFDAFAPSMNRTVMSNNTSSMQSNRYTSDPFCVLAAPPATSSCTHTWGTMPMNPSNASNCSTISNMINGCTPNFTNSNMMTTTTMIVNGGGGMMNNVNALMNNGNLNMMNTSNSMMMNLGFNNKMMHNGGANAAMMMNNGGGAMSSNMVMSSSMQQQFFQHQSQKSTIKNSHSGSPMFNTIPVSNNVSATPAGDVKTAAASTRSNGTKPDPFAGLIGL